MIPTGRLLVICLSFSVLTTKLVGENIQLGLRLPEGFEVYEYANHEYANDIYTMTTDSKGQITVAGRGYIRMLVDRDKNGQADQVIQFSNGPLDGAMGLLWENNTLFFTGDGGLHCYRDENGDLHADGPAKKLADMKTGGEHSAHAIRRGPDGWLYVLCGNMTGIDDSFASDTRSPITRPVAGCVVRFSPDFTKKEIVADGFRNAYDMDFNFNGDLFTYDSDNERCVGLPWYEPTRFYHVIPGSHYGWRSPQKAHFWRMPPYFPDLVKPLTPLGRGSPTGVTCYQHQQFPPQYHGAMFLADWTFGRVYAVSLKQSGSSYKGESHVFIQAIGSNGFASTDVVVHPQSGDLYVSTGGRGTRGAVYRIRYTRNTGQNEKSVRPKTPSRTVSIGGPSSLLMANMTDPFHIRKTLHWFRKQYEQIPPQDIETLILKTWDHPDRYIRQACAALIALMNGSQLDHLRTLCVGPSQELTLCQGIVNLFPDETLK